MEIPIMLTFDNNFVDPAMICIYSLLKNANKKYNYKIFILQSDIEQKNKNLIYQLLEIFNNVSIEFIDMKHKFLDLFSSLSNNFTKESLYKLLVGSIFTQYDKIIISDVDVIYCGDLSQSYFTDLQNSYFAGVSPVGRILNFWNKPIYDKFKNEIDKFHTICGGFLIANLNQIRIDDMENVMLNFLQSNINILPQIEQDVINYCCYKRITLLPLKYLVCAYSYDLYSTDFDNDIRYSTNELKEALKNPIHLHYAGIKPWIEKNTTKSEIWVQYKNELEKILNNK